MVMFEQSRRLSEPLRWGRREKTAVGVLLGVLLVAAVALGVYAFSGGAAARKDCIRVTFASTLGGADLHGCGSSARRICASGQFPRISHELQQSCERAGFAYRAPS
jgi:hypothetical protein